MSLSVTYDGQSLNDFLGVGQNYNAFDSAEWSNELRNIGNSNGTTYLYRSYGAKTITMPFYIKGSVKTKYDMLMTVLNVSEPKRLTFGNLANRYFLALPDGKVEFEMLGENAGRGTITWLIPDGVSHSVDTKIVTAGVVDGILTANVNNNGSDDIWPVYRFRYPKENGYQGIVHSGGILELGNRSDIDGSDEQFSLPAIDSLSNFSPSSKINPQSPTNVLNNGTLEMSSGLLKLKTKGSVANKWNGAMWGATVNNPKKDFYAWFGMLFRAVKYQGQTGLIQVLFCDANDKLIAGYGIVKSDTVGNTASARAYVGGDNPRDVYKWDFTASHIYKENPFMSERGQCDFKKEGANFTYYYDSKYPPLVVPELENAVIANVYIGMYQYGARNLTTQYVSENGVKKLWAKTFYDKWVDIQNRYAEGSELVVDTESANVYLDGKPANDELVNPPLFAPLRPGDNKIEFYQSDWSESVPEVTVEWKERYL